MSSNLILITFVLAALVFVGDVAPGGCGGCGSGGGYPGPSESDVADGSGDTNTDGSGQADTDGSGETDTDVVVQDTGDQ